MELGALAVYALTRRRHGYGSFVVFSCFFWGNWRARSGIPVYSMRLNELSKNITKLQTLPHISSETVDLKMARDTTHNTYPRSCEQYRLSVARSTEPGPFSGELMRRSWSVIYSGSYLQLQDLTPYWYILPSYNPRQRCQVDVLKLDDLTDSHARCYCSTPLLALFAVTSFFLSTVFLINHSPSCPTVSYGRPSTVRGRKPICVAQINMLTLLARTRLWKVHEKGILLR